MLLEIPLWRVEQTWDRLAVECPEEMSNLLRDMATSLRQVSLQPLALGWLFDLYGKRNPRDPYAFTEMSTCSIAEWPDF